jgi:acetyl esterase/lipase
MKRLLGLRYGPDDDHVGDLFVPQNLGPHPVVVVIHGGFWRAYWRRDLMLPIAEDLVGRGSAVWNIEYRRVGAGGGWPNTFRDVATALDLLDLLAERHPLDLSRLLLIGHSAGGHLAWWLAGRHRYPPPAALGGSPVVRPTAVVGLAPVLDLAEAERRALGSHAVAEFIGGGPAEVPERYRAASPIERLPLGIPQLIVHGALDDRVPLELSEEYVGRAREAGDQVTLLEPSQTDHFAVIDPSHRAWIDTLTAITALSSAGPADSPCGRG